MEALKEKYKNYPNIIIQTDFSSNETVFESDIMITDWSGIAYEFAYTTEKPVLFINTPMKVMNEDYDKIDTIPLNISLREEIGLSLDLEKLTEIAEKIAILLENQASYKEHIHSFVEEYVYHLGESDKVGAEYIIGSIQKKIKNRRKE